MYFCSCLANDKSSNIYKRSEVIYMERGKFISPVVLEVVIQSLAGVELQ